MKIAIFEVEPWENEAFSDLRSAHDVRFVTQELDRSCADDFGDAEIISTFIYSDLDRSVLEKLPNLRLIATRSTGFDHIDLDYCEQHGIQVTNVPSYGENTVAEHVFALLLAISHNLVEAIDRTRKGDFSQTGLRGFDLQGKTFGVIGTGSIGRNVARIARGFGMAVLAYDVEPDGAAAERIGFDYVALHDLLARSDVVSLHVPGTRETRHLISHDEFERMKDGSVLINTARGSVVDVRAMLGALSTGKIAAAGIDVLPEEPTIREEAELLRAAFSKEHDLESLLADHILLRLRNVLVTPHSAFNTREAVQRILTTTRENIEAFLAERPQNLVA